MDPSTDTLVEAAARPFAGAGRYAWHFARGKLRHDPVYFALLRGGLLPDRGRLLDLGCGQGILMAFIAAARKQHASGSWPAGWPAPPMHLELTGIEQRADSVRAARVALGSAASVLHADIRSIDFPPCSAVVMVDVLLYMDQAAQERLLVRAAAALPAGGLLLLREADAGAGVAFAFTQWAERMMGFARGHLWPRLHYRPARDWVALLERSHFSVRALPMSKGTPFSNVLFVATKCAGS